MNRYFFKEDIQIVKRYKKENDLHHYHECANQNKSEISFRGMRLAHITNKQKPTNFGVNVRKKKPHSLLMEMSADDSVFMANNKATFQRNRN